MRFCFEYLFVLGETPLAAKIVVYWLRDCELVPSATVARGILHHGP